MEKIFILLFLFFSFCFEANADNGRIIIPGSNIKAYSYTLNNGLRLVVIPDMRNTLATLNIILDAGSNREIKGSTGLAHFFEHMMFRKTKNSAEGNYDRVLSSYGGSGNAGTSSSFVTYYSVFPAPALSAILRLEQQRFMSLSLKDPYFTIEKGAVISERRMRLENDPFQRGYEIIHSLTERGTPEEWMVIGTKNDVQNLSIKTAQKFYEDFYTPNNTLIVIGGPFEPNKIYNLVMKNFGKWEGNSPKNNPHYPKDYLTRDIGKSFICSEAVTTSYYEFIYPSFDSSLKSVVYSQLFLAMLNHSPEGNFEYRMQSKKLANQFSFDKSYDGTKSNPIVARFTLSEDQTVANLTRYWDNEIALLLKKEISKELIDQVIKQQKVYNANLAEHLSQIAETVTENTYFFRDPSAQVDALHILQNINKKDFSAWVKKNFSQKKYYTIGIVPLKSAPPCDKLLQEHV